MCYVPFFLLKTNKVAYSFNFFSYFFFLFLKAQLFLQYMRYFSSFNYFLQESTNDKKFRT